MGTSDVFRKGQVPVEYAPVCSPGVPLFPAIPFRELPRKGAFVYALQASNGLIKFGCTTNVWQRMRALHSGSPLPAWAVLFTPGGFDDEFLLMAHCADDLHHGEWFSPGPVVSAVLHSDVGEWLRAERARLGIQINTDSRALACWGNKYIPAMRRRLSDAKKRQKLALYEKDGTPLRPEAA